MKTKAFLLWVILAVFPVTFGKGVKIFGLDSATKVDQDFIVVLKSTTNETAKQIQLQSVEKFTKDVSDTDNDDFVVSSRYSFGNFAALRVHLSDDDISKLTAHYDVDFVQANQKVRINQDGGACAVQSTGSEFWGLSRLSSHEKPDYKSSRYSYLMGKLSFSLLVFLPMFQKQRNPWAVESVFQVMAKVWMCTSWTQVFSHNTRNFKEEPNTVINDPESSLSWK